MISIATKNDINDIKTIENRCFSHPWTEKMLEESLINGCILLICKEGNQTVGYAGIYPSGDITNIAVLPEYRGRGYGEMLTRSLIDTAKNNNIDGVFLEVRVSNKIAIKLYEKCGFKCISQRKKYYSDGEDALIYALGGV